MSHAKTLRALLARAPQEPILAPGCFDALSASMIERAGFPAAYLSGASIAYTKLGRPDIGLLGLTEVAETMSYIRERVEIPVACDADTGFGNAINVQRTIQVLERAGASAIQLEDQAMPKRCGHLQGKKLVSKGEMVGKIKAAVDARRDSNTVIIARTDAIAVNGIDDALDRALAMGEAGADILFVEAPRDLEQMQRVASTLGPKKNLLANMVEGGKTPVKSAHELGRLGFSFVIFPGGMVRAIVHHVSQFLAVLKENGTTAPFADRMLDFNTLATYIGTDEMLANGKKYDEENA
jgi:2-methylisocitrate lyase-like PEP mutase family enzyme